MKKIKDFLTVLLVLGILIALAGGLTYAQFKTYQKKYGEKMTFFYFLIDAERGN